MAGSPQFGTARVDWADCAKGICIIMVVLMHSTLGVEDALGREGFMHAVVAFARPFRMPDFFLISGLFLARVIDRDWRTFLDKKVVHFAYFYVLWVTIQFVIKAPAMAVSGGVEGIAIGYVMSFIEPFGTLWFIYLLPIFFVVTKATRRVHPLIVWAAAAALQIAPIETGWTVIDEFAERFVFFYTGYWLAPYVFALADRVRARPVLALAGLEFWSTVNGLLVALGVADLPFVSLALGYAGALAVITISVLIVKLAVFEPVRYCGRNSIVIYLAFFLPMMLTRVALIKSAVSADAGTISLLVTLAGILGALAIWWTTRDAPQLAFLFKRPARFFLTPRQPLALQPAE